MRALIIGIGSIGRRHVDTIRSLDSNVEFIFLRRENRRDAFSRDNNATICTSLEAALDQQPDFAVIATPSSLHMDVLRVLLRSNLPLYIEKPVVTSRGQMEEIEASELSLVTLVGCHLRFLPSISAMKTALESGMIGKPYHALMHVGQWLPDWRQQDYRESYSADPDRGGGVMLDLIHEFDLCRYLFGEFDQVKCLASTVSNLAIQSEDIAHTIMRHRDSNFQAVIIQDYLSRQLIRRYEVVGEKGALRWDFPSQRLEYVSLDGSIENLIKNDHSFDVPGAYVSAMAHFMECAKRNEKTSQPIEEGLASLDLVLRAKEDAGL